MWIVAGLGNPGPRYEGNRHNVGFMVADLLASRHAACFRAKFEGQYAKIVVNSANAIVLKPATYMNESGRCVGQAMRYFGGSVAKLIAIHDELDLPFGTVRLKKGGGIAGHNGLRSIQAHCQGSSDFCRVRIGIGRPPPGGAAPRDWVLANFAAADSAQLDSVLDTAARATEELISEGIEVAMNRFNNRPSQTD